MKRIVILTGSEPRHVFFRKYMARSTGITVLRTYCEGLQNNLAEFVAKQDDNQLRNMHLLARRQSEEDFFGLFNEHVQDDSNPHSIPKGDINSPEHVHDIIDAAPDLLISYGCSIIREPLLTAYSGRFINVHLGLSPYYRGSGTNFWPLANNEPEYVGATFMHIDAGIDTGDIIHQLRARLAWGDTPSTIGNRLIVDMARTFQQVICSFDRLQAMPQPSVSTHEHYYRQCDYSEASVEKLYQQFRDSLVESYLREHNQRCVRAPIVCNPALEPTP